MAQSKTARTSPACHPWHLDVELVFVWPWISVFHRAASTGASIPVENTGMVGKGFLLMAMGVFFALLVFGLLYEWSKGAFEWD